MSKYNQALGALIFAPGVAFAIANATASAKDAEPVSSAIAAVVISGAVGAAVAFKPNRKTLIAALLWSVFSVGFELMQAHKHQQAGADVRVAASLVLGVVRAAGVVGAARLLTSNKG